MFKNLSDCTTIVGILYMFGQVFKQENNARESDPNEHDLSPVEKGHPPGLFGALMPRSLKAKIVDSSR